MEKYQQIKIINCVGGGSSAYGFWSEFIDYNKSQVQLIGVEAGGPKKELHAAPLSKNSKIEYCMAQLIVYKIQMVKLMNRIYQ